jgi:hypothetical protein
MYMRWPCVRVRLVSSINKKRNSYLVNSAAGMFAAHAVHRKFWRLSYLYSSIGGFVTSAGQCLTLKVRAGRAAPGGDDNTMFQMSGMLYRKRVWSRLEFNCTEHQSILVMLFALPYLCSLLVLERHAHPSVVCLEGYLCRAAESSCFLARQRLQDTESVLSRRASAIRPTTSHLVSMQRGGLETAIPPLFL